VRGWWEVYFSNAAMFLSTRECEIVGSKICRAASIVDQPNFPQFLRVGEV
jgi:hypothetical protein|tara:strand:- start:247 stop:396 length:150 start_codon:yes stop_codon:yes gene_type:complete